MIIGKDVIELGMAQKKMAIPEYVLDLVRTALMLAPGLARKRRERIDIVIYMHDRRESRNEIYRFE